MRKAVAPKKVKAEAKAEVKKPAAAKAAKPASKPNAALAKSKLAAEKALGMSVGKAADLEKVPPFIKPVAKYIADLEKEIEKLSAVK